MFHAARTRIPLAIVVLMIWTHAAEALDGTPVWLSSSVHTPEYGKVIPTPTLAFDHYGTPAICWSKISGGSDNTVFYSQLSGLGIWSHREITTGGGRGLRTALTFDRAERPITAWMNSTGSVQGEFNNCGTIQTITAPAQAPSFPILSLSCDLAGNLRGMMNIRSTGPDDFHGIGLSSSSSFTSQPMVTLSDLDIDDVIDAAMVTDPLGLRHLTARVTLDQGDGAVVISSEPSFACDPATAWPSMVFKTADEVLGLDMAVSPIDGHVAMAYTTLDHGSNTSTLWFAEFNGVTLEEEAILTSQGASVYEDLSLEFDHSDGRPGVAFEERAGSNERLLFAYLDGSSTWHTSLVDDSISMDVPFATQRGPSLAFDDYGTSWPAIAYIDGDESLVVAFDPPVPEPGTASLIMVTFGLVLRRGRPRSRQPQPPRRLRVGL